MWNFDPGSIFHVELWHLVMIQCSIVTRVKNLPKSWVHVEFWSGSHFNLKFKSICKSTRGIVIHQRVQNSTAKEGHNSTKNPLRLDPGSLFNRGVQILHRRDKATHLKRSTDRPDSPTTFPGTCKRNFLCLQMISFEFLREDSIGWIVSRGKHFVHMTRPGARDWPAACFPRPNSHTLTFTTIKQVNK